MSLIAELKKILDKYDNNSEGEYYTMEDVAQDVESELEDADDAIPQTQDFNRLTRALDRFESARNSRYSDRIDMDPIEERVYDALAKVVGQLTVYSGARPFTKVMQEAKMKMSPGQWHYIYYVYLDPELRYSNSASVVYVGPLPGSIVSKAVREFAIKNRGELKGGQVHWVDISDDGHVVPRPPRVIDNPTSASYSGARKRKGHRNAPWGGKLP